jgi:tyrosyl-tRNA synthetase
MSKTEGSYVALTDAPEDIFGKVMAMEDGMIMPLAELCTEMPLHGLAALERSLAKGDINPRDAKFEVATWVVRTIHGEGSAAIARNHFETKFMKRDTGAAAAKLDVHGSLSTLDLVMLTGVAPSRSAAQRLIEQGAVSLSSSGSAGTIDASDDRLLNDSKEHLALKTGDILKVGKRHYFHIVLR